MENGTQDIDERTARIRALNDEMRAGKCKVGTIVITRGIQGMGDETISHLSRGVAGFSDFTPDNDPHNEHDFGSLTIEGEKVFWKIDYYDLAMTAHSPDAADPSVTHRVLTIMLASEY